MIDTNHFSQKHFTNLDPNWDLLSGCLLLETFRDELVFTSTCVALDATTLLTSAHCVEDIDHAFIHFGSFYNQKENKRLKVKEIFIHPDYDASKSNYLDDLAVIKLDTELPSEFKFYTIADKKDILLERVGFGGRNGHNTRTWTYAKLLQETDKFLILEDWCSTIGDSGGPLFKRVNDQYELVGIHSTLEGDHITYAVNLSEYKEWIKDIQVGSILLQA